jgi:hypothetical protein
MDMSRTARIAGVFYLLNIVMGILALMVRGSSSMAIVIAAAMCYVVVTVLFYGLFKPVNRTVSMLAAIISLTGCAISAIAPLRIVPSNISPLLLFGLYCLLTGYLIFRSTFLPRVLGVLMAVGGVGWLTFGVLNLLSMRTGSSLPAFIAPGLLGEGALTVWLLAFGVRSSDSVIPTDAAAR